jgi:hypothetical protein
MAFTQGITVNLEEAKHFQVKKEEGTTIMIIHNDNLLKIAAKVNAHIDEVRKHKGRISICNLNTGKVKYFNYKDFTSTNRTLEHWQCADDPKLSMLVEY